MTGLEAISPALNEILYVAWFVFLRVSAFFSLVPAFGEQTTPTRIKLAISFAVTLIVVPIVYEDVAQALGLGFFLLTVNEIMIGALFGMGARFFILALQTAGVIAAQSTSLSQILGGVNSDPIPALGYMLVVAALCLATILGLHVKAIEFLAMLYELFPPGVVFGASQVADWGVQKAADMFTLAFSLAAPFILLSILYNISLGAISKAMPQLMVAFVGAPVITFGSIVILFAASPTILQVWSYYLFSYLQNPF